MKGRILFLATVILSLSYIPQLRADDTCDEALAEGKRNYNAKHYEQAKILFEFVQDECGAGYKDVASWLGRCRTALQPSLTVSTQNLQFAATTSSQTIRVTSNCEWVLASTRSQMFTVSQNGNNITVTCSANTGESRSDYFCVRTADGNIERRIDVTQNAASRLTVSKNSISCDASGTTAHITVQGNTTWEIVYPSGTMYSVTRTNDMLINDVLTVKIKENTSVDARSDFFNVRTTDGTVVHKINLSQTGDTRPHATIDSLWVDHGVYEDNQRGMKIHLKFSVYNMLGKTGHIAAYFYFEDGRVLKDINERYCSKGGNVTSSWESFKPSYNNSIFQDYTLFMPYSELHCDNDKKYELKFFVSVWDNDNRELTQSTWYHFYLTNQ